MEEFLRLFEGKALAAALRREGHDVGDKTVQRWKAGKSHPKPQDIAAINRLLAKYGAHEEAAPPVWAERLANETAMKVIAALLDPGLLEQLPSAMAALRAPQQPGVGTPPANGAIRGRGRSKR